MLAWIAASQLSKPTCSPVSLSTADTTLEKLPLPRTFTRLYRMPTYTHDKGNVALYDMRASMILHDAHTPSLAIYIIDAFLIFILNNGHR